jgi:hypothetical protein
MQDTVSVTVPVEFEEVTQFWPVNDVTPVFVIVPVEVIGFEGVSEMPVPAVSWVTVPAPDGEPHATVPFAEKPVTN